MYLKADSNHVLRNALEKVKARNAYLATEDTDVSAWKLGGTPRFHLLNAGSMQAVVTSLIPVYTCPWTLHRTNYVSEYNFDGGKWTCGVEEMHRNRSAVRPCVVYSFGSNNDDFFERDILKLNPDCEIHIFDPTSGTPPVQWNGTYHFHPSGLCVGNATHFFWKELSGVVENPEPGSNIESFPCKSLQQHMMDLNHTYVDILKADVEGMEWDLTRHWTDTRIGQVLLEIHFWHDKSPKLPGLLHEHIMPLERAGYFIHTIESVCANCKAIEIAFLNLNWSPDGSNLGIFDVTMYPSTPGVNLTLD
jgi:hypothetical protein